MTGQFRIKTMSFTLMALLAGAVFAGPVLAQGAAGAPPAAPGQGGGRGGFGGQRGGFGQLSAATIPVATLAANLKLSQDQQDKITAIQKDVRAARPQRGGQGGQAPDPAAMQEAFQKYQAAQKDGETRIEAVLNDTQKAALPGLIKSLQSAQMVGIPIQIYGDLKLSASQQARITKIADQFQADMQAKRDAAQASGDRAGMRAAMQEGRADAQKQTMAVLSDSQKAMIEKYMADHPRGGGRGQGGAPGQPGAAGQ